MTGPAGPSAGRPPAGGTTDGPAAGRTAAKTAAREPQRMELDGPLPTGTWVLEASAGTGKTYAIAGLVARYVAEGRARIDQILAVTFGRAATSELRNRVRERLVSVREALRDVHTAKEDPDEVVALLANGDAAEVALRRDRLSSALADFDAATVATVHEFCQQVLHGLGVAADFDPGTELVENLDIVRDQVAEDLYLRWAMSKQGDSELFPPAAARRIAKAAVADREAVLLPRPETLDPSSAASVRVRFAQAVRAEVDRRTRAARVLGFDDLLTRVRDALADPVTGPVAAGRLRSRYAVVLVDEFQDTDPVQWDVLRLAFNGHRTLVVIGDPKQAIYAFRGADVRAYLRAVETADTHATLETNWRSDRQLVSAMQSLFRGAALGDQQIKVRTVGVGHVSQLLTSSYDQPAIQIRQLRRDRLPTTKFGIPVDRARPAIAEDVAAQIHALLGEGCTVTPRPVGSVPRPMRAADIAVLVRTGRQANLIRDTLRDSGIPAVLTGTESVYTAEAARDWVRLLEGLEQPHRATRIREAALTSLVGWTAAELDQREPSGTDELGSRLREWAEVLAERGVAALFATVSTQQSLTEQLLRRVDGERVLTDLRHIAEALHTHALRERLALGAMLTWLRERVAEAVRDPDQERSRRLDTDAAAVQITTVHTSKGLEFPVVLVPFGWDGGGGGERERTPRSHDDAGQRTLHVGGVDAPGYARECDAETADEAGEELRLLYVATTRAISRLILWWAPSAKTGTGPLHRLLFTDEPGDGIPAEVACPDDDAANDRLSALAAATAQIDVQTVTVPIAKTSASVPAAAVAQLSVARLHRTLDQTWRRTSYSGLTRAVHEAHSQVVAEPQVGVKDDEGFEAADEISGDAIGPGDSVRAGRGFGLRVSAAGGFDVNRQQGSPTQATEMSALGGFDVNRQEGSPVPQATSLSAEELALAAVPSPMADLPAGAEFGTLVHAILETAELSGVEPNWRLASTPRDLSGAASDAELWAQQPDQAVVLAALTAAAKAELRWSHKGLDPDGLAEALLPAVLTPWGPIADGACLADFGPDRRLTELGFELPLAGGDRATGRDGASILWSVLADLAPLLERHLPVGDPVRRYAAALRSPGLADEALRGYLSGSLDLVVRVGTQPAGRYLVVDHKTNRLSPPEVALTAWHYRREALDDAVLRAHYPLQAMLYSVALHRFLRWRQFDYDPETHLGGVAYLFLRGMCGAATPAAADGFVPGVWTWRPPASLVVAMSDLLAGSTSPLAGAESLRPVGNTGLPPGGAT